MHFLPEFVLVAGVVMVGIPTFATARHEEVRTATAMVRFVNNTPGTATLNANGEALFENIATGTVTKYAQLADTSATFTLVIPDQPGEPPVVTQKIEDGASYTVTARNGMEGKPELTVAKDETPNPAPTPW